MFDLYMGGGMGMFDLFFGQDLEEEIFKALGKGGGMGMVPLKERRHTGMGGGKGMLYFQHKRRLGVLIFFL